MNLSQISDEQLLNKINFLVQNERETLTKILHHLREIQKRRLYSQLKYGSLFEYATKHLGYSEDQAWRRIAAMRLLKEIPEIEEKITNGSLSLSHLGMAKSLFNREEKSGTEFSKQQKFDLLTKLEKTSKREAEKIVSLHAISSDQRSLEIDLRLQVSEEFIEKINKLKGLLAHKHPHIETSELLDKLCDLGIEKWSKGVSNESITKNEDMRMQVKTAPAKVTVRRAEIESQPEQVSRSQIKRQVWQRDQGRCQNCHSKYALEIDHIQPKSLGGSDTLNNLRLLCRSCNQREAIKALGVEQMSRFLKL